MSNQFPTRTINGTLYKLHRLEPIPAARVATRVAQLLAPLAQDTDCIRRLIEGAQAAKDAGGEVGALLEHVDLLSALAGGVSKIDGEALFDAAMKCVDGRVFVETRLHDERAFNAHFADHANDLMPLLVWAVKENCSGFFDLGAVASKPLARAGQQ